MENIEVLYFKEYFESVQKKYSNNKNCYTLREIFTKPNKCGSNESLFPPSKGLVNQNEILFGIGGIILFTHQNFYILTKTGDKIFGLNKISHLRWEKSKGFFSKGNIRVEPVEVTRHNIEDEKVEEIVNEIKNKIPGIFLKIRWETERVEKERKEVEELDRIEKEKIKIERSEKEELDRIEKEKIRLENERQRKIKLEENKVSIISTLDKDGNGDIDLVDDEILNKILFNNQKNIIEIDKIYIQKFVKISMYIKTKRSNIQNIFTTIKDTKNDTELNELLNLLENQRYTYDLLVFHSINMITSLVESDLITFYQIYECFDELGVFNSNWENEVSGKLSNIGNSMKELMYSIYQMENKIVNSIGKLTYTTQSSYNNLNLSINNQLRNINSSLDYNNYMTKIQNYKMFDILL